MEIYKEMLIYDLKEEDVQIFKNVKIETKLTFNKNGIPVRGGQGLPLIGTVGGTNETNVTLLDISKEIRDLFLNQKVNIYLNNSEIQVKILNTFIHRKGNDLITDGGNITRVLIPS